MVVPPPLLIVANSARYLAQSALIAGRSAVVVDAFADRDTRQAAMRWCRATAATPRSLVAAAREFDQAVSGSVSSWVYGAGLEAAPELLDAVSDHPNRLCGNRPEILRLAGSPAPWIALLEQLQIDFPETRLAPPGEPRGWLFKPSGGCGGIGVQPASWPRPAAKRGCFQRRIRGHLVSLLFAADGRDVRVLGYNELFARRPDLGDFRYAGAIGAAAPRGGAVRVMRRAAQRLTSTLGLRGINGLDFVLQGDAALLLELNARPPATLELYEPALPNGGLGAHLEACAGDLPAPRADDLARGHRLLYASTDLTVPAFDWPEWCSDRPLSGSRVAAGAPLCSVRASGIDRNQVKQSLRTRAAQILRLIESSTEEAA